LILLISALWYVASRPAGLASAAEPGLQRTGGAHSLFETHSSTSPAGR
jgi:hypothetical protein